MTNLANAIKFEAAFQKWIASDAVVARLASESNSDMRRLFVAIVKAL